MNYLSDLSFFAAVLIIVVLLVVLVYDAWRRDIERIEAARERRQRWHSLLQDLERHSNGVDDARAQEIIEASKPMELYINGEKQRTRRRAGS